jgi:hypothetical protein
MSEAMVREKVIRMHMRFDQPGEREIAGADEGDDGVG